MSQGLQDKFEQANITITTLNQRIQELEQQVKTNSHSPQNLITGMLSEALDQASDAIIITDSQARIEYVNHAFSNITCYQAEEVIGKTPQLWSSGHQNATFYKQMWRSLVQQGQWNGELVNRKKNGECYPASLHIRAVKNHQNKLVRYIAISSDLTETRKMEERIQKIQKIESLSTVVGGVAHHFNNILAGLVGNIFLAENSIASNSEASHHLKIMQSLCNDAANIVKQMMAYAHEDIVYMKKIDLNDSLQNILNHICVDIPQNIAFKSHFPEQAIHISADQAQLKEVMLHMLQNAALAVVHSDIPKVEVNLTMYHPDRAFYERNPDVICEQLACISVRDNGCGIHPDKIDSIFEPFVTTRNIGEGKGLGLSMIYGVVKRHGGTIEFDTCLGKGSCFNIYIPSLEQPPIPLNNTDKKHTIFLVDDDHIVRKTTAQILQLAGYTIIQAESMPQALELFEIHQDDISIALLDILMPNGNGIELAQSLLDIKPKLPIIYITGYNRDEIHKKYKNIQNPEILTKPVHIDVLQSSIHRMLNKSLQ